MKHMKCMLLALVPLLLLAGVLVGQQRVTFVEAAPAAHAASLPPCGQTVSGMVVNKTTNTFAIADLDQQNLCDYPQLHAGPKVVQSGQYTVSFDLNNMAGSTDPTFDAWIGFRRTDQYNKYSVHFLASRVEFRVRVNDHETTLGSAPYVVPITQFAHLKLVMNGFTFNLVDRDTGTTLLSVTDANQTFASGPTLLLYVDGRTFVCWDNVSGAPGLS